MNSKNSSGLVLGNLFPRKLKVFRDFIPEIAFAISRGRLTRAILNL